MARTPKPWYRKDRKCWVVTIHGKRHNLGRDKEAACQLFYKLMHAPKVVVPVSETATELAVIVDAFLDWTQRSRAPATYEWYRERLQGFVTTYSDMEISAIRPFHIENWAANGKRKVNTRRNLMRWVCHYCEDLPGDGTTFEDAETRRTFANSDT